MYCPICDVELKVIERFGVQVDVCSQCRGVWLDRGELDKIIRRSMALAMPFPVGSSAPGSDYEKAGEYEYA